MKSQNSGSQGAAAERYARFNDRPDVQFITAKYADFVATPQGVVVSMQLSCEAISLLSGRSTREQHGRAIEALAHKCSLPVDDLKVLAECAVEVLRLISRQCSDPLSA